MKGNPSCVLNPYRVFKGFIAFILLAYLMTGCVDDSSNTESPPVVSPPITSPPVVSPPVTSPPVVSPPVTSPPVVSPPVTSPPVVSPPVTSPPVVSPPVTSPPVVSPPVTSPPVTSPPVVSPPVTSPPVTSPPVVSPPVTSPPVTSPPVVSPPVTSPGKVTKGLPPCPHMPGDPPTDRDILIVLYCATDGDNWQTITNWLTNMGINSWYGVTTNSDDNTLVTGLNLGDNRLSGTIPSELGSLTNLLGLYLHENELSGTIPPELGNLTGLTTLSLSENELSGTIPSELGSLTNLLGLYLHENELSGTIPPELDNLTGLTTLSLSGNELSGTIPSELGALTNLLGLYLHQNELSGTIPSKLGSLTGLSFLWLSRTELSGTIPSELGALTELQNLVLHGNELSGTIPSELGALTRLINLNLSSNELSGTIPDFSTLQSLLSLEVSYNTQLTGELRQDLIKLENLSGLNIRCAKISTPSDEVFQNWLASISFMEGGDDCPPEKVTGVSVTAGVEELTVSWSVVSGADGYRVQWKSGTESFGSSRQHTVTSGSTVSYMITGLTAGTKYTVRVIATKSNAHNGIPSDDATGTPKSMFPLAVGRLTLRTADTVDLRGKYYGNLYSGTYSAPDDVSIDVWVSVREMNTEGIVGTVNRMGVIIQGGTGVEVTHLLGDDKGLHTLWVAINYRGSSIANFTAEWECIPGAEFISCLKEHDTFSKINPKLNAQDANSVIRLFTDDDGEITVDGVTMKASDFVPAGTIRSPINLYTNSFGGVIVSYMLAEENRPELHNVFFEQVTVPNESPISDGLNNAARMMDILFSACENDTTSCSVAYPDIRVNFRDFMDTYHSTAIEIDGEQVYAGGVFDRIVSIIDNSKVGKAIRYIGEIAKAHANGDTVINIGYGPERYNGQLGEQPRATYGLPQLDGDNWPAFLQGIGYDFFPGITNRTAMICSFGINRATSPDSLSRYNEVKGEELSGDTGGTKEMFGYGFLVAYRTFLRVCPQLIEQTGRLELPDASDIEAKNVIVYRGGLDIKHYFNPDPSQDEIMAYFTSSQDHRRVITHKFLGQQLGEDQECLKTIFRNFWNATDTTIESLGDDCEESNDLSASKLAGW